uniref:Uncharacterized protein n=1 Tax=Arundo donax TaxID=35708 RepID=A0A0A9DXV7_ARUDO
MQPQLPVLLCYRELYVTSESNRLWSVWTNGKQRGRLEFGHPFLSFWHGELSLAVTAFFSFHSAPCCPSAHISLLPSV